MCDSTRENLTDADAVLFIAHRIHTARAHIQCDRAQHSRSLRTFHFFCKTVYYFPRLEHQILPTELRDAAMHAA